MHYLRPNARAIILARANGKAVREIADEMGCTPANVSQTLKRHKNRLLDPHGKPLTYEHLAFIEAEAKRKAISFNTAMRTILAQAIENAMNGGGNG